MARKRAIASIRAELIRQSREAALNAVQTYNNPLVMFKSQTFIVLMVIAWTYLLHAYYRQIGVDYRYPARTPGRQKYQRTKAGYRYWDLGQCLNSDQCPLEADIVANLQFLIEIRHFVKHRMVPGLDESLAPRYQACALNYCDCLATLFGEKYRIEDVLPYSLQFSQLSPEQIKGKPGAKHLPPLVQSLIQDFDAALPAAVLGSPRYAVTVHLRRLAANNPRRADAVIEFGDPTARSESSSDETKFIVKRAEPEKFLPGDIVELMRDEGFQRFNMHHHTELWKQFGARDPNRNFGTRVRKTWYWYTQWVEVVRQHCKDNADLYR